MLPPLMFTRLPPLPRYNDSLAFPNCLPAGSTEAALAVDTSTAWLCEGSCAVLTEAFSTPDFCPMERLVSPGPLPWCTGIRPRRSGSPNVVRPSPP